MPYLDGGFGLMALVWVVVVVAFWSLIILGLVLGVRWLIRADRNSRLGPQPTAGPGAVVAPPPDAVELLRQRYARGEIDEDEFERRSRTLSGA